MAGMDKLVNVTNLCFPNNVLTDECIDVLTKSITNKKIQELNLSNNKVGLEGGHKWQMNSKVSNEGGKNLAVFIAGGKSCLKVFSNTWRRFQLFSGHQPVFESDGRRGVGASPESDLAWQEHPGLQPLLQQVKDWEGEIQGKSLEIRLGLASCEALRDLLTLRWTDQSLFHKYFGTVFSTSLICLLSRFASLKWFWKPIQTYIFNNRPDYQLSSLSLSSLSSSLLSSSLWSSSVTMIVLIYFSFFNSVDDTNDFYWLRKESKHQVTEFVRQGWGRGVPPVQ